MDLDTLEIAQLAHHLRPIFGLVFWSVCARVSGLRRDQDKVGEVDYIDDIARRKEVDLCHEHSVHSQNVIQTRKKIDYDHAVPQVWKKR